MKTSTMIAYAEVDTILSLMDDEYVEAIPVDIRYKIKTEKEQNYVKKIDITKPLTQQNINKNALSILAYFNYEYWSNNQIEKEEFVNKLVDNKLKQEKIAREKYNPNNIFKKEEKLEKKTVNEETSLVPKGKESFWTRIINKIKSIFSK